MKTEVNIIKSWFKKGSKPTQEHFWNLIDSLLHKDELIPQESIEGLSDDLAKKAGINQLSNKANADATGLAEEQITAWKSLLIEDTASGDNFE
nr:MAG TPA: hypothetical protein [Caudoviricetes sp.]